MNRKERRAAKQGSEWPPMVMPKQDATIVLLAAQWLANHACDFPKTFASINAGLGRERERGILPTPMDADVLSCCEALATAQTKLQRVMADHMRRMGGIPPEDAPPAGASVEVPNDL